MRTLLLPLLAAAGVVACAAADDRTIQDGPSQDFAPNETIGSGTPDGGGGGACVARVSNAAPPQVDIVFVVDTSGSMKEEADQVKANINTFAKTIGAKGIDYHVIMIAEHPYAPPFSNDGICVPEPLAGPKCADKPDSFHQLGFPPVGSKDSLHFILNDFPQYQKWMRRNAYKVFIEVSDDESSLGWKTFDTELLAKPGDFFGTESARRYIFNGICGWKRGTPHLSTEKCETAMQTGNQYQKLADLTGGIVESVCETDYSAIFDSIAKGLVARLGCEFAYPGADNAQTDPTTVVVNYTPGGGGAPRALTQVTDASKCGAVPDAWYYDDNKSPTKLLFCPATCATAGADTAGKLQVAAGCTAPPPR